MMTSPQEYEQLIDEVVKLILTDPTKAMKDFSSPENLVEFLEPGMAATTRVFQALKTPAGKQLGFTPTEVKAALKEKARKYTSKDEETRLEAEVRKVLGDMPKNEREYVHMLANARKYRMTWDRMFFDASNERLRVEHIARDMHLTASDLKLTKPSGDRLGSSNIDRALEEWAAAQRAARQIEIWKSIETLTNRTIADKTLMAFRQVCEFYFEEPDFAEAAMFKFIWQVKRRMKRLPINQVHMLILLGAQNSGKTVMARMLTEPVAEMTAECSLKDVLDERQMDLPAYFVLNLDELVFAERAEAAALKSFITGADPARRPMRTNIIEKIENNATLIATSNHSLGRLIYDSTGMRRFIEVKTKERKLIEPYWDQIVAFDWAALWQAVDETRDDPIISMFGPSLIQRQEELRNPENSETWAKQFEFDETIHAARFYSDREAEFFAADLYSLFKEWEEEYDRGYRGTSLTRWGRDMKSLIELGSLPNWEYRKDGNRSIYILNRSLITGLLASKMTT